MNLCIHNNGSLTSINSLPHKYTVVDVLIVSSNLLRSSTWNILNDPFCSDHIPLKITILIHNPASSDHVKACNGINVNAINWSLFQSSLSESLSNFLIHDNVTIKYNYFIRVLHKASLSSSFHMLKTSEKSIRYLLFGGLRLVQQL